MMRYRGILRNAPLRRWATTSETRSVAGNFETNLPAPLTKRSKTNIYDYIDEVTVRDVCGGDRIHGLKLLQMIEGINQGNEMRRVRNKLTRRFKTQYSAIFYTLRSFTAEANSLDMKMFRKIGPRQLMAFHKSLIMILRSDTLTYEEKKNKLYEIIRFQHDLFPESSKKRAIIVPELVHKWFWENLPKEQSFNHYYFLIKNDIALSSSVSVRHFGQRLMQGSEMDLHLVTLQVFLHDDAHKDLFYSKFSKLYSFDFMIHIINKMIYMKDFRNVKIYLSALLFKMDTPEVQSNCCTIQDRQALFIKFNNCLLYYLSKSQHIDMFLDTFTTEVQYMKKLGLLDKTEQTHSMNLLHKPLLFVVTLLRKKGLHEEVFKLISLIQKLPMRKTHHFNNLVLNELISSFRSFNDPKLTCHYTISAFKKDATAQILNELRLWGTIFHNNHHILSKEALNSETYALDELLPESMRVNTIPPCSVLTEIYRVVLSTNARVMNKEQYQTFILNLYSGYTSVLKQKNCLFKGIRHDTGILNVFLYHIRFELNNFKLAYEILKDFYDKKFSIGIRNTSTNCPFSLVIYKNTEITESQVCYLLDLMHQNQVPLGFQLCTGMVLRYLKLNNHDEALLWYKRILHAGFSIKHSLLVQAIQENNWEFPPHFDVSSLNEIGKDPRKANEDELLIEDTGEFIDSDTQGGVYDNEKSLLELIDLIEDIS